MNDDNSTMFSNGYNISDVTEGTVYGNLSKAYGNAMFGLNRHDIQDTRESPKDHVGFTFFTRPMLNLQLNNIKNDRLLYKYMTTKHNTVEAYCRSMLDRLLVNTESLHCPMADNLSAFIPILSANLLTLSGFIDVSIDSYVSPAGSRKQQYNILDGTDELNESIDLTATFKNTYEDAVVTLFNLWTRYMVSAKEGILSPHVGFLARRLVDSHSRIFRLVMTEDKRYVKRIAATGPIYPDVNSVGKYFDVNEGRAYSEETRTHSIKFKCMGVEYNDPILVREFNSTVGFFNPMMRAVNKGKDPASVGLMKLNPMGETTIQFKGYPRINESSNELEWYVEIRK